MKTDVVNTGDITRSWFVVDATDKVLGRLSSRIATVLVGKNTTQYSPNQDHGDHVIVINCEKVRLTGKKTVMKQYFRHSGYPGGDKLRSFGKQMEIDPAQVIVHAVRGMVPKTTLGRKIMKKLHVYKGSEHPHGAQQPVELALK
jgi:large subunit ribosomal protein L13